jgi:hypothetical protein
MRIPSKFDPTTGDRILKQVIQPCDPTQVLRAVVPTVGVDVIDDVFL